MKDVINYNVFPLLKKSLTADKNKIEEIICNYFCISKEDLKIKRKITKIRFIYFFFLKNFGGMTLEEIGKEFGFHHTTVQHGIIKASSLEKYQKDIEEIKKLIILNKT